MRLTDFSILSSLAFATVLSAGCQPPAVSSGGGTNFPSDPSYGNNTNTNTNTNTTTPTNPLSNGAHYNGIYEADAQLDFTQQGVLPGLISPALAALANVGTDPGTALVNFAQAAGAIDLDSALRSVVASVITSELNYVLPDDVQKALDLISNITRITRQTTLTNTITVHTPSSDGTVIIDIQVTGAAFDFVDLNGNPQHVVVKTSAANLATARTTLTATIQPHGNAPIADADLIFNGGAISIPIGDFILQAMGPLVFKPEWNTTDLLSTLRLVMSGPCNDLGGLVESGVNDLFGVDVGPQLGTTICNTAVVLAAAEIQSDIGKVTIDNVKVSNARGVLMDASTAHPTADHQSDSLTGNWTWTFGGADVPAYILNGVRTGNSN